MHVRVYAVDQSTGRETFSHIATLEDIAREADRDEEELTIDLWTRNVAYVGGGAAQLFRLIDARLHLCRTYPSGVGHIDAEDDRAGGVTGEYRVTFYGPRVAQSVVPTLEAARFALRRMALAAR